MLKRLLASMAIVSLLLGVVVMVYWWRSNHGHNDDLTLGTTSSTQSHFLSRDGRVAIETSEQVPGGIRNQMRFYPFKEFISWFLILPGLWLAIKIRSVLPRPGRGRNGIQ